MKDVKKNNKLASELNAEIFKLKNAVDNENNYNIGITGSYGSGKSSIIII